MGGADRIGPDLLGRERPSCGVDERIQAEPMSKPSNKALISARATRDATDLEDAEGRLQQILTDLTKINLWRALERLAS